MIIEPGEKTPNTDNQLTMPGSEDSEEESSQEEQPVTPWSELTIVERVGLNSVEMSEEEVENAFCQIALAFSCDQYTLKQRLQGEEHARNLAEENIQLELTRGRETLETLKELCLDSKRRKILQRLELCLDILGGTVERILNTAEVLGAVHQEARVSRAVDLMVVHVENLKRRHNRDVAEMEEAKKLIQHNCRRNLNEPRIPRSSTTGSLVADAEESEAKMDNRIFQQYHFRRRVSTSVISKQTKEKRKGYLKKQHSVPTCLIMTKDDSNSLNDRPLVDPEDTPSETSVVQPLLESTPIPSTECPPKEVSIKKTPHKSSPLDALRHRHKGKATLSKKKTGKNKKGTRLYRPFSLGTCGLLLRQRPSALWLHRCRWVLLCIYFLVLLCVVTLTYYLVLNFL